MVSQIQYALSWAEKVKLTLSAQSKSISLEREPFSGFDEIKSIFQK